MGRAETAIAQKRRTARMIDLIENIVKKCEKIVWWKNESGERCKGTS